MKIAYISPVTVQKSTENVSDYDFVINRRHIQQAVQLQKLGAEVIFYRLTTSSKKFVKYFEKVKIVFCPVSYDFNKKKKVGWSGGSEYSITLLNEIRNFKPDIIHFYNYLLGSYWFFFLFAKLISAKMFAEHVGGYTLTFKSKSLISWSHFKRFIHYKFLKSTNKIMIQIPTEIKNLQALGIHRDRLVDNIPHIGIDTDAFRVISKEMACLKTGANKKNKNILFVGRILRDMTTPKNPFILIDVLKELNKKYLGYNLIIIGDGPDSLEFRKEVNDKGLTKQVIMPGWVSSRNILCHYYNSSDIFVFPHIIENIGGVGGALNEAMSCGVPSIVYSNKGQTYKDNYLYYVKPHSEEELVKAIVKLSDDHILAKKMSDNCLNEIKTKFIWKNIGMNLHTEYSELIKN